MVVIPYFYYDCSISRIRQTNMVSCNCNYATPLIWRRIHQADCAIFFALKRKLQMF